MSPRSKATSWVRARHSPFLGLRRCSDFWFQGMMWLATSNSGIGLPVIQQRFAYADKIIWRKKFWPILIFVVLYASVMSFEQSCVYGRGCVFFGRLVGKLLITGNWNPTSSWKRSSLSTPNIDQFKVNSSQISRSALLAPLNPLTPRDWCAGSSDCRFADFRRSVRIRAMSV